MIMQVAANDLFLVKILTLLIQDDFRNKTCYNALK